MKKIISKRALKIIAAIIAFFVLAGIAAIFALPPIVKPILIEKLSHALHREVAIEKIAVNPFTLTATVSGFAIMDPGGHPFVSFDELYVNAQGLYSLFKGALILKEVRLTKPYVNIVRREDGTYNFSDLVPKAEPEKEDKKESKPFHFSINNIRIVNGALDFDDRPVQTRHAVTDMDISIPFISNISHDVEIFVEPRFSAAINGRRYELTGKTRPFAESKEVSVDLEVKEADLPFYLNYVPAKLNCKLLSAVLDAKISVNFIMPKSGPSRLKLSGDLALKNVALDDLRKGKILRLPATAISIASIEPLVPDVHIAKILVQSPEVVVSKGKDGEINLANLTAKEKEKAQKAREPKAPEAAEKKKPEKAESKLKMRIDEFAIDAGNLKFIDRSPADPVRISVTPLNLKLVNLSTEENAAGNIDLSLVVDNKGSIAIKGPVRISPDLAAELSIDAKNIGIRPLQPYFTDKVKIDVKRGAISASGSFTYATDKAKKPVVKYTGKIAVAGLATMDKATSNDFLDWKQLFFDQVETGFNPFFLNIRGISLTDFYARIIINPDGTTNLQNVFGAEKKEGEAPAPEAPEPEKKTAKAEEGAAKNIKIGRVTFQGGTIDFADHKIKPNYSAEMLNIGGSVSGLSSDEATRAAVDLRGNLGYGSPIEIRGSINPLIKDLYADIGLRFRDIELSPATPYSAKFLGYPILKGKLTFDVAYLVEKRKLDAKNKVFIDQLTFGEKTDSPDAVKAPVTLAVSLLTDRNGQINLDIPVSGSLDDPKFRVWPIVWQVIVNLITKAATAPFSLLASLVGGGEELSYVEFDYGSDRVTEAGAKKIASLAKALYERPNLKLDASGFADPEKDREGLKQAALARKVKVQKLKDMVRKGDSAVAVDNVKVDPKEYEKYLTLAYKAESFPKPRNVIGIAKELPAAEMEKLIVAHVEVTDSDLRLLASRRAENIKEMLLKKDIASSRIFVVEPKSAAPEKKENVKASRVDFRLK
jgi:uncharacterized protein involved in outer membrane biogenesis